MARLSMIEGIGGPYEGKLKEAGIKTTEVLLEACSAKKGRAELAVKTGISEELILKWANRADLSRIRGVGREYSNLLEAAGVDTVPELAKRNAENLHKKMAEVNEEKKLVRMLPTENQVKGWKEQAMNLPRMLNY